MPRQRDHLSRSISTASSRPGEGRLARNDPSRSVSFSLRESDIELLKWIQEQAGYSASDALRTSIRAYAQTLADTIRRGRG